jgi:hypothetical protein
LEAEVRRSETAQQKCEILSKKKNVKEAVSVAQVVELSLNKHKFMSSNPKTNNPWSKQKRMLKLRRKTKAAICSNVEGQGEAYAVLNMSN